MFTPQQLQAVAREAPERIEVPSGSRIKLHYEPGKPPVLAVRIQEVFGMLETPCIAAPPRAGPVALAGAQSSPAASDRRPGQFLADDLSSSAKGPAARYPKHAWPEDPYTATAERRPGSGKRDVS